MALLRRESLSQILNSLPGIEKAYFQPNEKSVMEYPCVTYFRDPTYTRPADNKKYLVRARYKITLIDRQPENPAFDILLNLPYSSHVTSFVADGLHHDVFDLYH